jgi:hypothetical protein
VLKQAEVGAPVAERMPQVGITGQKLYRSGKSSTKELATDLRLRIREIAQARVRYGYREIRVLLNREGWKVATSIFPGPGSASDFPGKAWNSLSQPGSGCLKARFSSSAAPTTRFWP